MAVLKKLSAQKRVSLGKGCNRRTRKNELVPGVFYSAAGESIPLQVTETALSRLYAQVGRTTVFELEIDDAGKTVTHPVLVWEVQRDPVKSSFTHIDFYGVDLTKPVKITVPIEFTGIARGTKVGGRLEAYRERVQLVAKPLEMPAKVILDISNLDLGSTIQVADLKLPEGVTAAYDTNYAIVSVVVPGGAEEGVE